MVTNRLRAPSSYSDYPYPDSSQPNVIPDMFLGDEVDCRMGCRQHISILRGIMSPSRYDVTGMKYKDEPKPVCSPGDRTQSTTTCLVDTTGQPSMLRPRISLLLRATQTYARMNLRHGELGRQWTVSLATLR